MEEKSFIEKLKEKISDTTNGRRAVSTINGRRKLREDLEEDDKVVIEPSTSRPLKGKHEGEYVITVEIPEGVPQEDVVAGWVKKASENTEKKEEEQKKKDPKSKLRLIPLVLLIPIIINMRSCQAQTTEYIPKTTQISYVMYDAENPTIDATALNAQAIQEGATNNELNGQSAFHGDYYDCDDGYKREEIAARDSVEYEELKENLRIHSEAFAQDIDSLHEMMNDVQQMSDIYKSKSKLVDSSLESFIENTNVHPDGNTETEIDAAKIIAEDFHEEQSKVDRNLKQLQELNDLVQDENITVNVDSVEIDSIDGDITISGETVEMIAETRTVTGLKAAEMNIRNFFKNLTRNNTKSQDKDTNIQNKNNER